MVKRIVYTVHGMLKCSSLVNGVLLAIPLFFIFCFPTMAMNPVKNCHCFKERTYNPQNKFSSDNYILTTTTNSFISVWFKFNKKNIVMMKMKGGVNSDDLLIGLYVASLTGEKIDGLIQLHQQGKTWKTILTNEQLPVAVVKDPILSSLANGVADQEGANRITNSLLSRFFSVSPDKIDDLSLRNFTGKEITLLLTLSAKSGINAEQLANLVVNKGFSYSQIAYNLGFQPGEIKKILNEINSSKVREN